MGSRVGQAAPDWFRPADEAYAESEQQPPPVMAGIDLDPRAVPVLTTAAMQASSR
jgi:hypothetical protein